MANTGAKNNIKPRFRGLAALLLILCMLAVNYFVCAMLLIPRHYDVAEGMAAPETIHATRNVVDEVTTAALKNGAKNAVEPVYSIDAALVNERLVGAEQFFSVLNDIRALATEKRSDLSGEHLTAEGWGNALSDEDSLSLCAMTEPRLTDAELYEVLAAANSDMQVLRNAVIPRLSTALSSGLTEDSLPAVKSAFTSELAASTGLSDTLKALGVAAFERYVGVTCVEDAVATEAARAAAAAAVEEVTLKRGEVIVEKGGTVTEAQFEILDSLNLVKDGGDTGAYAGLALYLVVVYALFALYMLLYAPVLIYNLKKVLIISVTVIITLLLSWLCLTLNPHITPVLIAVMLTALLVSDRAALAVTLLLAASIGVAAGGGGEGLMQFDSLCMFLVTVVSGAMAVFSLRKAVKRGSIIIAGVVGGAAGALLLLGMYLMKGEPVSRLLVDMGWTAGCAIIAAILVVGSLSVWENLFDAATPARLNELLNANHPLLKQLMLEAPGTYQHSVAAAALAEGAAGRIGADPLLSKVAAYYHDVGKLRRPLYFTENQKNGVNIHDTLPPAESAAAIIAHQKDGVTLLTKYKLPGVVRRIAGEHHGNSLMIYFYHKACEQEQNVNQKLYRYPGNKPSSPESALVMLADSCEAAVRSLGECTREQREEMVHRVIWGKLKEGDNQLAAAPLTLAQLSDIERSFNKTLSGMLHERIEYPDEADK